LLFFSCLPREKNFLSEDSFFAFSAIIPPFPTTWH
jgi:hypothetical protein